MDQASALPLPPYDRTTAPQQTSIIHTVLWEEVTKASHRADVIMDRVTEQISAACVLSAVCHSTGQCGRV